MKKKVFIVILVLGFLGAGYGLLEYQRPNKSLVNEKAVFKISASTLLNEFDDNEEQANQKFLDKVVEVEGIVQKIVQENNKTSVYLETESMMSSIICELETKPSATLKEGQTLKLKGICTGFLMDVILVRSVII